MVARFPRELNCTWGFPAGCAEARRSSPHSGAQHARGQEPLVSDARKGTVQRVSQGRRLPLRLRRRLTKSGWRGSPTPAIRAAQVLSLRPGEEAAVSSGPQTYHQSGVTCQTRRRPASVCTGTGPPRAQAALKRACSSCSAARSSLRGFCLCVWERLWVRTFLLYQRHLSQGVWDHTATPPELPLRNPTSTAWRAGYCPRSGPTRCGGLGCSGVCR